MTTISPRLLADVLSQADDAVTAAQATDIHDHLALVRSHATLRAALRRVLWTLDAEDEPDVAAQAAAEDGIHRPVYVPYTRTGDRQVAA